MARVLSPSAQRIQNLLNDLGHPVHVVEYTVMTRTAAEAAAVIGCDVGQIAKSIIFRTRESSRPVLVVASGMNRVNEAVVGRRLADRIGGERLVKADPEFVRTSTGFPIGGVAPVGHTVPPITLFDQDLLKFETVYAAAGTPNSIFAITPEALLRLTGGVTGEVV
ncbi:YbaK/EbsC family protein [Indioceanicola profundi]|uniref:YbaK/EbsC family protein n=1 Tax=Indioceanicola profundi TaxID=2220096 RepID=UPI000E6AAA6E|nr:YbaK/EbsC family protein [Indioceanicola profundi]